jgi:hypothetical protein
VAAVVEALGLDQAGWRDVCDEARGLASQPEFTRLQAALVPLLEQGRVLDAHELKHIHAAVGGNMEHKTKSATAVVTDQGAFTALAATRWTGSEI